MYNSWRAMKGRCQNPNQWDYKYYGAKGIYVCEEWKFFREFMEWALANNYKDGLTIDRVDPNLPYTPSNCRWITHSENVARNNRVRNIKENK